MTALLFPLGTLVSTNALKSIAAFQTLADKLALGIQIPQLLQDLNPLFLKFNLGVLTEKEFGDQLLGSIEKNIPELQKPSVEANWKEVWSQEWKAAWNVMCQFDDRIATIASLMSTRKDIQFYIYSDTNPTHLEFISPHLSRLGVDLNRIYSTFSYGNAIDKLLLAIYADLKKTSEGSKPSIVIGNPEHILEGPLRQMALQKRALILSAVEKDFNVISLEEPYLTVSKFQTLLSSIKPSQPIMAFSSEAALMNASSLASSSVSSSSSSTPIKPKSP